LPNRAESRCVMKKRKNNHLAEGEATGHYHKVGPNAEVFEDAFGDDSLKVITEEATEVEHQEHGTIQLPPGKYRSDQVLVYDSASEAVRRAVD